MGLDLNERCTEAFSDNVDWFPKLAEDVVHHALGLTGEAGECANIVKKFDRGSMTESEMRAKLVDELPDVLVYVFSIAGMLGIDLEEAYDEKRKFNEKRYTKESTND
jgi:NTP pyrophosphatase (non-canonical NTP hydrolase)